MNNELPKKWFRHSAAFGKRIEYFVIGSMLKEGLDVFLPMIDDDAIDAVIKKKGGSFMEIQIKACSRGAFFAAISHKPRNNYWFVFYSEDMNSIRILSSKEFIEESSENKRGKNLGKRSIKLNGKKGETEFPNPKYDKYLVVDFRRIQLMNPDIE